MRARSNTVYSKKSPFRNSDSSPPNPTSPTSTTTTPPATSSRHSADYLASLFDSFGPVSDCKIKDVFAGDFQPSCTVIPDNLSSISTSIGDLRSRGASYISCDDFLEEEIEGSKPNKVFRIMVIGTASVGKHALVSSLYPEEEETTIQHHGKFDLMTRKIEKDMEPERYHFWIKEAGQRQRRHRALLDVYYKSCSVFFLVYNEDDRESFEEVEREIEVIREVKREKEVQIVLVGNKGRKREVMKEEVEQMKDKYKVKICLEGDEIEGRQEEIREMIAGTRN